jgi:hypothetical protein
MSLPDPPLLTCSLESNKIGVMGAAALSWVLKSNTTLTELS